ncbi:MAG: hypothetical protein ABIH34_06800, partial [Nanoarchaeota archaeon]
YCLNVGEDHVNDETPPTIYTFNLTHNDGNDTFIGDIEASDDQSSTRKVELFYRFDENGPWIFLVDQICSNPHYNCGAIDEFAYNGTNLTYAGLKGTAEDWAGNYVEEFIHMNFN